jgi:hypothetical protein
VFEDVEDIVIVDCRSAYMQAAGAHGRRGYCLKIHLSVEERAQQVSPAGAERKGTSKK